MVKITEEEKRLNNTRLGKENWKSWGPYLSERQWGVVREDYSQEGNAWDFLTHEQSRSHAYRWGEDGIGGISDDKGQLCFALTLWNGQDPILKERLFGLSGSEGNHGEDVKEYYFYLDNTPTHSYMKYLYKYPQKAFPYEDLVRVNKARSRQEMEYELLDTGIFHENRYFDVFIEYAKASSDDILIQITAHNRSKETASLHLLPTLWFRNTWSWETNIPKPRLKYLKSEKTHSIIQATHEKLGDFFLFVDRKAELLFTENESNTEKLFGVSNASPFVKDSFHDFLIQGKSQAVNSEKIGTKAAACHILSIEAGKAATIKLRLSKNALEPFNQEFDLIFNKRKKEADAFYRKKAPKDMPDDLYHIQRQAYAGLLWNKQCYHFNVDKWLKGDPKNPLPPKERLKGRNHKWWHLDAYDVFSMPDKWEYPWFASWDLAFHTISFAIIDPDFAKNQLLLLTKEWYMHPSGQIPAYEWEFGDVNPPVHAWAAMRIYQIEKATTGKGDRNFLERIFQKLLLNFNWWVNQKDAGDRNIFEGGFLGLDNIGLFDRSKGLKNGSILEQPDGTGWMGMYCLNLLEIALELSSENPVYEDMATKFFEHFVYIADAINNIGNKTEGLWDEEEGFYGSLLRLADRQTIKIQSYSLVGLIPLFAVATSHCDPTAFPGYRNRFDWFVKNRPELLEKIGDLSKMESEGNLLLSLVSPRKLRKILQKVLDENHFLSPYGLRSLSRCYEKNPYSLKIDGQTFSLDYEPAESTVPLFGGNSNWRGPIWFPLNFLFIETLQKFHYFLGDDFKVEYPTGSEKMATLWEISSDITKRLIRIFTQDANGKRPVYGGMEIFQTDPHFRNYLLFHEYFHGDNGAGLGASNQTGWTGLVAKLIQQHGAYTYAHRSPTLIEKNKIAKI